MRPRRSTIDPPDGLDDLDLGERPHEPLHLPKDVVAHTYPLRHRGETESSPLPLVLMGDIGGGHAEAVLDAVEDGLDHRSLLLQRVAVGQVLIELQRRYVRGISRSS